MAKKKTPAAAHRAALNPSDPKTGMTRLDELTFMAHKLGALLELVENEIPTNIDNGLEGVLILVGDLRDLAGKLKAGIVQHHEAVNRAAAGGVA